MEAKMSDIHSDFKRMDARLNSLESELKETLNIIAWQKENPIGRQIQMEIEELNREWIEDREGMWYE